MRSASLLALTFVSAVSAQQYTETFTLPDGPSIPNWTQDNFTWVIRNQRAVPDSGARLHYLTLDLPQPVTDCVLDVDVYYPPTAQLCYGGLCARHPGGSGEQGLVMTKLQDNTMAGSWKFNTLYMYERPGSGQDIAVPPTAAATVRLIVKDRKCWTLVDTDQDGLFDVAGWAWSFTGSMTRNAGRIGLAGYNEAAMDNFKFFDAVLLAAGPAPRPGLPYAMSLRAPLVAGGPTPWICLLSLGKAGIPLDPGRAIPLSADDLLLFSFTMGLGGVLTQANVDARIVVPLPYEPSLVDLQVFASAFTFDASRPFYIGAIANDHQFRIQKPD